MELVEPTGKSGEGIPITYTVYTDKGMDIEVGGTGDAFHIEIGEEDYENLTGAMSSSHVGDIDPDQPVSSVDGMGRRLVFYGEDGVVSAEAFGSALDDEDFAEIVDAVKACADEYETGRTSDIIGVEADGSDNEA